MKTLLYALIIGITMIGCDATIENLVGPELRLDGISLCGNPDLDYVYDSPELWRTNILEFLKTQEFNVQDSRLDFEAQPIDDFPICGNCNFTGHMLFVRVPDEQQADLLTLGFKKP